MQMTFLIKERLFFRLCNFCKIDLELFGNTAPIYFRPFNSFNFNLKCLKYIGLIYNAEVSRCPSIVKNVSISTIVFIPNLRIF